MAKMVVVVIVHITFVLLAAAAPSAPGSHSRKGHIAAARLVRVDITRARLVRRLVLVNGNLVGVLRVEERGDLLKGAVLRFGHFEVGEGPKDGEKNGERQKGVALHGFFIELDHKRKGQANDEVGEPVDQHGNAHCRRSRAL